MALGVFLHIWRAADKPTAGCTAMTSANAKAIFSQLDASKKPLLIQMTNENYENIKKCVTISVNRKISVVL